MRITATALIAVTITLASCSSHKTATTTVAPTVLTNTTEQRTTHTERIDTIYIELPSQSHERETADSISTLETDFAISTAEVKDGILRHTLRNKTAPRAVTTVATSDTIYITATEQVAVPQFITQEVERSFSAWEKFRLSSWKWLVIALLGLVIWKFRHYIAKFFSWLIVIVKRLM